MKLFICVENRGGFSFFNKRLSRDKILIENMLNYAKDNKVYIELYSEELFENKEKVVVMENPFMAPRESYVFSELIEPGKYEKDITKVILYLWNRDYPYSNKVDLDFEAYELEEKMEFKGNSHDKITRLIYNKKKQ